VATENCNFPAISTKQFEQKLGDADVMATMKAFGKETSTAAKTRGFDDKVSLPNRPGGRPGGGKEKKSSEGSHNNEKKGADAGGKKEGKKEGEVGGSCDIIIVYNLD
jgi:hypothetical protein